MALALEPGRGEAGGERHTKMWVGDLGRARERALKGVGGRKG
jgi:hypothetical protein